MTLLVQRLLEPGIIVETVKRHGVVIYPARKILINTFHALTKNKSFPWNKKDMVSKQKMLVTNGQKFMIDLISQKNQMNQIR